MTIMRTGWLRGGLATGAVAAVLLFGGHSAPTAQTPRPMSLVDLIGIPRILDPQLSPDGRAVIYMLQREDWKADQPVAHIWRQAVGGGAPMQLTSGKGEMRARWSPDSQSIMYWAGGQLFLMPAAGGDARQLTHHATTVLPNGASGPTDPAVSWAPDGRSVYFLARDAAPPASVGAGKLVTFEETDFQQQHVWKVDIATGVEQQVTRGDWSVIGYHISRDGKHATLLRSPTPLTIDHYHSDVWVLDLDTGALHEVTHNGIYETEADLSPDHSQVYFVADANQDLDVYYGPALFVVPAAGGTPRRVSPDATYMIEQAEWAPDGKSLLAVANMGVHQEIIRVDVATGTTTPLTNGDHTIENWSIVPAADRMIYQAEDAKGFGDAWTLPIGGGTPAKVTGDLRHPRPRFRDAARRKSVVEGRRRGRSRRHPLLPDRISARAPLSPHRAASRRPAGIQQVRLRRRRDPELRSGAHRERLRCLPAELSRQRGIRPRILSATS